MYNSQNATLMTEYNSVNYEGATIMYNKSIYINVRLHKESQIQSQSLRIGHK